MSSVITALGFDEWIAKQLNPHIPVNEAIAGGYVLDLRLKGKDENNPPGSPAEGDGYIVGPAPTGAWSAFTSKNIAYFHNGAWQEIVRRDNLIVFADVTGDTLWRYEAGATNDWVEIVFGGNPDALIRNVTNEITVGYRHAVFDAGTKSSGTFTPSEANGWMQKFVNGGSFVLNPPTNNTIMILQGTNNASAGTITTSGFGKVTGDALTTTDGDDFIFYITTINGFSHLEIIKMTGQLGPSLLTATPTSGQTVEFVLDDLNRDLGILVWSDVSLSATDSLVIEFRRKSDGVWEQGASAYRYRGLAGSTGTLPANRANIKAGDYDAARGNIWGVFRLSNFSVAAPTSAWGRDWDNVGELHGGFLDDVNVHDRVRVRIVGAATFTGNTGTFYLTLHDTEPTVETYDFGVSGAKASHTFTPPAGATESDCVVRNVTTAASTFLVGSVDAIATSTYLNGSHRNGNDDVILRANVPVDNTNATTGHWAHLTYYGLKQAMPTVVSTVALTGGGFAWYDVTMQTGEIANSTFEVKTNSGANMTAGQLYAVHHKRRTPTIVETANFAPAQTPGPTSVHAFADVSPYSGVLIAGNGITHTANTTIEVELSEDAGSTWKNGATDYEGNPHNNGSNTSATQDSLCDFVSASNTNDNAMMAENVGISGAPTCLLFSMDIADANGQPFHYQSQRLSTVTTDKFRWFAGNNMNAGKAFVFGVA